MSQHKKEQENGFAREEQGEELLTEATSAETEVTEETVSQAETEVEVIEESTPESQGGQMEKIRAQEEQYLRLLAEYDNYRKRSQRERENAWNTAKAETAAAFLPVYDNLARALQQETVDEAYAKGVQMTMNQLKTVLEKLGVEEIPALGETFDPLLHNAVMHIEDESLGKNTVAEVFEAGFRSGDKVIRHSMVKVAN